MTLIYLALAWLFGIVIADAFQLPLPGLLVAAGVGGTLALCTGRVPRARLVALLLCCAALGAARFSVAQVAETPYSVWQFNERGALTFQGIVVDDSKWTEDGQRVLVQAQQVQRVGHALQRVDGLVLVKLPPYPERHYGDRLQLTGELQTPRAADRDGQFDYRAYLVRKQIFSLMEPDATRLVGRNAGSAFWTRLLAFRERARQTLLRELPEPQASLAVGILIGLQSSIPPDVYDNFSTTGTSHILVISGWNITSIATALYGITSALRLSKNAAFWAILGCIWLYTLFVGATPTVIRAAVMGTIVVLGQRLERPAYAWTTLFAACWAMTIYDPQTLWDLGFQLSALATASLFAFGKPVEALLLRTPLRWAWLGWAREALTATLAAQILALPLILYQFGNLSLIAPLANVVLLPVVPYAMLYGALALGIGMCWLPAGQVAALAAYPFLTWLTEGTRFFANVPFAAVQIPPFPLWVLLAYYALVLGGWLLVLQRAPAQEDANTAPLLQPALAPVSLE